MTTITKEDVLDAIKDYDCKSPAEFEEQGYASEFADSYIDIYTADLLDWAGDNMGYVDEALSEHQPESFTQLIQMAQGQYYYEQVSEILNELSGEA